MRMIMIRVETALGCLSDFFSSKQITLSKCFDHNEDTKIIKIISNNEDKEGEEKVDGTYFELKSTTIGSNQI